MTKILQCAYCNGMGKDPFHLLSSQSVCQVCGGSGKVEMNEPSLVCVYCSGTGKNPLGARIPCIVCHGKGRHFSKSNHPCQVCHGSGKLEDGLTCSHCGGVGFSNS